jgi:hypothetical protein
LQHASSPTCGKAGIVAGITALKTASNRGFGVSGSNSAFRDGIEPNRYHDGFAKEIRRCAFAMEKERRRHEGAFFFGLAEWTGLEPATLGVTGRYSNRLNYHSLYVLTDMAYPTASRF